MSKTLVLKRINLRVSLFLLFIDSLLVYTIINKDTSIPLTTPVSVYAQCTLYTCLSHFYPFRACSAHLFVGE